MAGKRHHFIPQFLQRGFASHVNARANKADECNAWVYRKSGTAFNTNIKNIGLEGQFYSHDGDTVVDDTITDAEGPLATFVTEIRGKDDGAVVDSESAANLLMHISMRTRHLRKSLSDLGGSVMGRMFFALSDEKLLERKFLEYVRANPESVVDTVKEQLDEVLARGGVPERDRVQMLELLLPSMLEAVGRADIRGAVGTMARTIANANEGFQSDPTKIEVTAKNGHLRALRHSLAPPKKLKLLADLSYRIHKFAESGIILGDSGAIFALGSARGVVPFFDGMDPLGAALLPLDSETCLIGVSDAAEEFFSTSEVIRKHISECSLEYFLANTESDENLALVERIGTNARLLTDEEIDGVMAEMGFDEGSRAP